MNILRYSARAASDSRSDSKFRRISGLTAWALVAISGLGCALEAQTTAASFVARDSAGVDVVDSRRPAWRAGEGWRLAGTPMIRIGMQAGLDAYLLHSVRGAARLDDGRIVVANGGDKSLRFYGSDGRYINLNPA